MKKRISRPSAFAAALLILILLFLISFTLGRYGVPLGAVCRILLSRVLPLQQTWTANMETAVLAIRMPRILMACLVGCCLACAGASYQGVFQNPMASPDVLGASSGAAFGAALAILAGASRRGVSLSAFCFSLVTVAIVYLISQCARGSRMLNLVLGGMIVSALFNAGTSYLKLVADPTNQLPEITYWLMGSLNGTRMDDVIQILPVMLLGLIPLFLLRWKINILTLGDDEAQTMGISVTALRLGIVACSTLITAACISVSGMIGWVGLIVPHLCRRVVGSNFKALLPMSMVIGAAFLLLVDDVSRNLLAVEIPIGILTAIVGAPFFLCLMMRKEAA